VTAHLSHLIVALSTHLRPERSKVSENELDKSSYKDLSFGVEYKIILKDIIYIKRMVLKDITSKLPIEMIIIECR
jgi:hypothetical protein